MDDNDAVPEYDTELIFDNLIDILKVKDTRHSALKCLVVGFVPFQSSHSSASWTSMPQASCGHYCRLNFALPAHLEKSISICY